MNKSILIILNAYFPEANANTYCMEKHIEYLREQGMDIDIFTIKADRNLKEYEIINNINVYRFNNWYINSINKINSICCLNQLSLKGVLNRANKLVKKIFLHLIVALKTEPIESNISKSEIVNKAIQLNEQRHYKYIISVCLPFVTVELGVKIQRALIKRGNKTKFIIYHLDPFSTNLVLNKSKKFLRIWKERQAYKLSDKIIFTPEMFAEMDKWQLIFKEKIVELAFPILSDPKVLIDKCYESEKIKCIYAGNFYSKIRSPDRLMNIFLNEVFKDIQLHLYGCGCEDIINRYENENPSKVFYHGQVNKADLLDLLKNANILLSLGNNIANQTPSKIYDLISLGKPIIHLFNIDNDSSLKYLKRYPLCLCVDERKSSVEITQSIICFIRQNKNRNISFEDAVKNMETYRSGNILKYFYKLLLEMG